MEDITAAYARELQSAISGIEIRTPEHTADRAQRHRIEAMAVWITTLDTNRVGAPAFSNSCSAKP